MKEYIERDAAEELLSQPITMSMCLTREECLAKRSQRDIDVAILRSIPAADVRLVVRCRDCKHRDPEDHKRDCGQLERAGCVFPVDDDYFCAYGEKREES